MMNENVKTILMDLCKGKENDETARTEKRAVENDIEKGTDSITSPNDKNVDTLMRVSGENTKSELTDKSIDHESIILSNEEMQPFVNELADNQDMLHDSLDLSLTVEQKKDEILGAIYSAKNVYVVLFLLVRLVADLTKDHSFVERTKNAIIQIYGKVMAFRFLPFVALAEKEEIIKGFDERLNADPSPTERIQLEMDRARIKDLYSTMSGEITDCKIEFN